MVEPSPHGLRELLLNATLVVAATSSLLYLVGVASARAYLGALGIPTPLALSADQYIADGFAALAGALLLAAVVGAALSFSPRTRPFVLNGVALALLGFALWAAILTLFAVLPRRAGGAPAASWHVAFWPVVILVLAVLAVWTLGRATLRRRSFADIVRSGFARAGWSGAVAVGLLAVVFAVYVGFATGQGNAFAAFHGGNAPLVCVVFESPGSSLHEVPLVLLLHYDGRLYLMRPHERLDAPPDVHVVPEDDIVSFSVVARNWLQAPQKDCAPPR